MLVGDPIHVQMIHCTLSAPTEERGHNSVVEHLPANRRSQLPAGLGRTRKFPLAGEVLLVNTSDASKAGLAPVLPAFEWKVKMPLFGYI